MAAKKAPTKVRPKTPARIRKKRAKRGRGRAHPELVGLGLFALGLFLAAVLLLGWDGGVVGEKVDAGLARLVGAARFALPPALLVVGGLMVARSGLIDVRPFRSGLGVLLLGLLMTLGAERGGETGEALEAVLGRLLGSTGTFILGAFLFSAGVLLVTGASVGAILRRSAVAARAAGAKAVEVRRTVRDRPFAAPEDEIEAPPPAAPPLDGEKAFPDVVTDSERFQPPPSLVAQLADVGEPEDEEPAPAPAVEPTLFESAELPHATYRLPDPGILRRSRPTDGQPARAAERTAEALVAALANFGVEATVVGQVSGPRVTRYELQLAPGTKVGKVASLKDDLAYALATTEIRILAPIPGKQAVGVEVPNLAPNLVTLGDIYDDLPATASPLAVWLGKDISGNAVWTDLARMPHLLIAGTTGSGKSGCI